MTTTGTRADRGGRPATGWSTSRRCWTLCGVEKACGTVLCVGRRRCTGPTAGQGPTTGISSVVPANRRGQTDPEDASLVVVIRSRIHSHIDSWLRCFIQREGGRRFEIARRRETVVEMALVVGHGPVCSRGFVESTSMWSSPASGSSHEWERRKGSGGVFASARKASVVCPLRSYKLGLPHPQESFGWRVH